jgi:hypothetical protein
VQAAQGGRQSSQSNDELSERKPAKLYEQLGRVMVERDFLLRKFGL